MKKRIILSSIAALLFAGLLFTGCSKDDTSAPVITLKGSNPDQITLNGGTYSDPGATANDDEDGSVSVSSTYSSTNPDVSTAGPYTITYSASDKAGNSNTASRTVNVVIQRSNYIWTGYSADDSSSVTGSFTYTGNISAASAADQIIISNFSGTLQNCVASVNGATVTIASQTVGTFTISGSGTMNNKGNIITINYTAQPTSGPSETHIVVLTKQ